jgi:hypothetical protein
MWGISLLNGYGTVHKNSFKDLHNFPQTRLQNFVTYRYVGPYYPKMFYVQCKNRNV